MKDFPFLSELFNSSHCLRFDSFFILKASLHPAHRHYTAGDDYLNKQVCAHFIAQAADAQ